MARVGNIWRLYAVQVREILEDKQEVIPQRLRDVIREEAELRKWKFSDRRRAIYEEVAISFFQQYLWAYQLASHGYDETDITTAESCQLAEETTGYKLTREYGQMTEDINLLLEEKDDKEIAVYLVTKYGPYSSASILADEPTCNSLPDYAVARVLREIMQEENGSQE